MAEIYISGIPASAKERVTEHYPSGQKREAAYLLNDEVVGARLFFEDGKLELESPRRSGLRHGTEYQWDDSGQLRSAIPYVDSLEHGVARQWGRDGVDLGTYQMYHGTGIDLWRAQRPDGSAYLAEVRFLVNGERHGFEWLIEDDQASLWKESRYAAGVEHGIFREWSNTKELVPDFPRFYLLGRRVSHKEYEYALVIDTSLPHYREEEDLPARLFLPSMTPYLKPPTDEDK